ncbi:MAG: cation-translocating P-type ATPase [Pseudomonadales bacterium]|nr:cation-translocating P-type ATPase [Pseudomonadales bacterium]
MADVPGIDADQSYLQSADELLQHYKVDPDLGLAAAEVFQRRAQAGLNSLAETRAQPLWRLLGRQFSDVMILVLIAAALVAGLLGDLLDMLIILLIVLLNGLVGAIQAYRAERAVAALQAMVGNDSQVLRDGQVCLLPSPELVPGDIVSIEAGMVVPADLRLLTSQDLVINEAALTGESVARQKSVAPLAGEQPVADRLNMAFSGTQVERGRARGLVTRTGMTTQMGQIARLLEDTKTSLTPLQQRLAVFGQRLALAVLLICGIIFAAGLLRGEPLVLMFLVAVSLAVAAIPEALPAVISVALAFGARKMSRQRALIRHLPAVETLGSVTVICTDKTGTLTLNQMHLDSLYADHQMLPAVPAATDEWALWLQEALVLNNNVVVSAGELQGDPTEVALCAAGQQAGLLKPAAERRRPRLAEFNFDAERKRMTTVHKDGAGLRVYAKGAPETILALCEQVRTRGGVEPLERAALLARAQEMAAQGYRVLALATKRLDHKPADIGAAAMESKLEFLALVGLIDPPRPEARQAVAECRAAGIRPVMITGDHPATALAIARRLQICDGADQVVSSSVVAAWTDAELQAQVGQIHVYARVSPQQKLRIVAALQAQGEFCAMTGDGVNDAPALKRADIGIAMGQMGTHVAREAADMVLLDDNFATIVSAIREGRRIYANIRKFIKYTMTSNAGEVWTLFLAPLLGLPLPLLPVHILWINLVTDGLPGLALTVEPAEAGSMRQPPRPTAESIFAAGMWQHILWVGLLIGGVALCAQAWVLGRGASDAEARTAVFTVLTLAQLAHVMAIRSEHLSLWQLGLGSNRPLLATVAGTVVIQLLLVYNPWLNQLFSLTPLSAEVLCMCGLLASLVFVAVELEKYLCRRRAAHLPT